MDKLAGSFEFSMFRLRGNVSFESLLPARNHRARIEPSKLTSILEVEDLWDGMVSVRFCSFGINRTRWGYRYTAIFLREIG